MAVVRWHEQFSIGAAVTPKGHVNLMFTEDTGAEANMFPLTYETAVELRDKLTEVLTKAKGIEVPSA
jgi:hypothetical protein